MVSGPLSAATAAERLVKRNVDLSTELQLGAFEQKDTCVIVLSDGEELHIPHRMLGDVKSLLTSVKPIELTTPPRCQPLRPHIVSMSKVTGARLFILSPT
ncbi:unnamed protein product [Phytophthora fragariaefolia]|uniref:Unnamed protein product n=1 Tax=Phytophthora fragariaefolia TaxID=1490495 RepID=A0A9W6TTL7_9STRA|nr:unnamed protein product [Phytophthora fragariaefolia]